MARKEIQDWSGRQFDPEVVAVFQKMPDEVFEELRRAIGAEDYPSPIPPAPKSKGHSASPGAGAAPPVL